MTPFAHCRPVRALALASLVFGLLLLVPNARAQEALFFDTMEVAAAQVEVVVTDREGQPVTGLTRDDFTLVVDGEAVAITDFLAVVEGVPYLLGPGGPERLTPEGADVPPSLGPTTSGLQLVVLVDDLHMRPEARNRVLGHLRSYLEERLAADDRVMLVSYDGEVRVRQAFTADRELLVAALDELEKEAPRGELLDTQLRMFRRQLETSSLRGPTQSVGNAPMGADVQNESAAHEANALIQDIRQLAERQVLQVRQASAHLSAFCASLGGIPGRKALLYVSDGLPERPADPLVEAWRARYDQWLMANPEANAIVNTSELPALASLSGDSSRYLGELAAEAAAHDVVFYPLADVASHPAAALISAESRGLAEGGGGGLGAATSDASQRETSLLRLAEVTGGAAATRTFDIGRLVEQARRDFATFYSLGYSPPEGSESELRRVEVRLAREGLKARHVTRYRAPDPEEALAALAYSALRYDVERNPLEMRLVAGEQERRSGDRYHVTAMVQVPFQRLLLLPEGDHHSARLTLYVVAGDERGTSPGQRIDLPIEVPNAQLVEVLQGAAAYPLELELRSGRQRLVVALRDELARIDAAATLELVVGEAAGTERGR